MSCFFIFILIISSVDRLQSVSRQFSLQTGASVTIPCRYDIKYIHHKKYWCYDSGAAFNYCTIQAYTNETKGKVTVTDNPAKSLFTVMMKNLQTGNTGSYWCVVEIGGIMEPDIKEQLYITVKADPDLSVMESSVRGEEGGSITVQCLYSTAYKNTQKQWCRFKDGVCNTFRKTETSQNSAVLLSDNFSVQMIRLKKSDAGWYWCRAGDLQVPVHISVSDPRPGITTTVTTTTHHVSTHIYFSPSAASVTTVSGYSKNETLNHWYLVALLFLLAIIIIIICMLRKKCKSENQIRTTERGNNTTVHTAEESYSSIVFKSSKKKSKQRKLEKLSVTAEDSIIYSSVADSKPKVSPKDGNDGTIYGPVVYK